MSSLAQYFHDKYPVRGDFVLKREPKATHITIPVKKLTVIKASVLAGIAVTYFVPPQWAWLSLIPNAYWMYKL